MKSVFIIALLTSCMSADNDTLNARQVLVRVCGPAPDQPGLVVAFDLDVVTMRRSDYTKLRAYLDAIDLYAQCVTP